MEMEHSTPTFSEENADGVIVVQSKIEFAEDLEEQPIHDQLPTLEELKSTHTTVPSKYSRKVKSIVIASIILVVFCTFLGVTVSRGKKKTEENAVQNDETEKVIQFLLKYKVSLEPDLRYNGTPQRRAAQFLAYGDGYKIEYTDANAGRIVDRYSLAVLYYALGGKGWTYQLNFLSARDTCDWNSQLKTTAGTTIQEGVQCDNNGRVMKLMLGKALPKKLEKKASTNHRQLN